MTSETRVLRPFVGTDGLEGLLSHLRLRVGTSEMEPDTNRLVEPHELLTAPVELTAPEISDEFASHLERAVTSCQVDPDDCEFLVIGRASRLKKAEILYRSGLTEVTLPRRLDREGGDGGRRRESLQAPFSGCTITVYVVLARNRPDAPPLQARMRGTWLARADFRLATDLGPSGITVHPLTDEIRERHALPSGCLRFVDVEDVLATHDGSIDVYLDEKLLGEVDVDKSRPAALSLQYQIYLDVVTHVVLAATVQFAGPEGREAEPDSLLHRVAKSLVSAEGRAASQEDQVDELVRRARTDPFELIYRAEDKIRDLRGTLIKTLRGDA